MPHQRVRNDFPAGDDSLPMQARRIRVIDGGKVVSDRQRHWAPKYPRVEADDDAPAIAPSPDVRDTSSRPCCCVCGREQRGTFWICARCKREHGLPDSEKAWPAWAIEEKLSEERRRYRLHESLASRVVHVRLEDELDEGAWPGDLTVAGPDWPRHE